MLVLVLLPQPASPQPASPQAPSPQHREYKQRPARLGAAAIPLKPERIDNELLVKFKKGVTSGYASEVLSAEGAVQVEELPRIHIKRVKLRPGTSPEEAASRLMEDHRVEFAEPNWIVHATDIPNDPLYSQQWGPPRYGAQTAWDVSKGSGVKVAVIDTGVDYDHPDLSAKVTKGYNFVAGNNDPMDDAFHGTFVAGIAAAITDNGVGVAGTGWSSTILAIKVLDSSGSGTVSNVANGIIYAADNGAKIANLSLGGYFSSSTMDNAVVYAREQGLAVIAAAGNDNVSFPLYPASSPGALNVGATALVSGNETRASFSNFGSTLKIMAPGQDIISTLMNDDYAFGDGTSFATPAASGCAALVSSMQPTLTGDQIVRLLMETATDFGSSGWDQYYGYGRVDAAGAAGAYLATAEEGSPSITYSGSWSTLSNSGASSGQYKTSSSTGASATFSFTGFGVAWVARKGPAQGIATIEVDGASQGDVDLYSPVDVWQSIPFTETGLSSAGKGIGAAATHTIKVIVKGQKNASSTGVAVSVDAFDALRSSAGPTTPGNLYMTHSGSTNNLAWTASSDPGGVAGYEVERATGSPSGFSEIGTTVSTSYSDAPAAGSIYYYRVRAYDDDGNFSDYSDVASSAISIDDVNGDGRSDGLAFFNYGRATTSEWTFKTSSTNSNPLGITCSPSVWWSSGVGSYDLSKSRGVTADFDGNNAFDLSALYDYGGGSSTLRKWTSTRSSFTGPTTVFSSTGWNASSTKLASGDFNADGKDELFAFYNYGGSSMGVFVFEQNPDGSFKPPRMVFFSPYWNWSQSRFLSVKSGGQSKVIAAYNYGGSKMGLWVFELNPDGTLKTPRIVFYSAYWNYSTTKFITGDIHNDGRSDVIAFYNYGGSKMGAWVFKQNADGTFAYPVSVFYSAYWNHSASTFIPGDFDGDGRADAGAVYNYGNNNTGIWVFRSNGTALAYPVLIFYTSGWNNNNAKWIMPY